MRKFQLAILLAISSISVASSAGWQDFFTLPKTGTLFSRGAGFWSSPADEKSTSFFGALTDPKSQRENWYALIPDESN